MNNLIQLEEDLTYLKLHKTFELVQEKIEANEITTETLTFLQQMCEYEKVQKHKSATNAVIKVANFPHLRGIEDFEFAFQPNINEMKIRQLCESKFIDDSMNVVFIGTPGVGKTHLASAIGLSAASKRISVYFIKCNRLLQNLRTAYNENRLEERLKHYKKYKLLIIDEVGFLPIDDIDEKLLFQLIDARYECRSTIFTSNITLDKWHTIFRNQNISNAIIDRIIHHSYLFNINGSSYRVKDKIDKSVDSYTQKTVEI